MNTIDIIMIAVLGAGGFFGWHDGFLKSLCSFAGFLVGLVVAALFYAVVGEKLAPHLGSHAEAAPIIAFILVWVAFPIAMNFVGNMLTKFVSAIHLGFLNQLAGVAIGVAKFFLAATLVFYVMVLLNIVSQETASESFFGSMMIAFADSAMQSFAESRAA